MDNFKQQQIETCKRYIINESLFGQQYDQLLEMMQEMNVELKIDFNNCYLILAGIEKRFYNSKLNLNRENYLDIFAAVKYLLVSLEQTYEFEKEMSAVNYDSSKLIAVMITPKTSKELPIPIIADQIQKKLQQQFIEARQVKHPYLSSITLYSEPIVSYAHFQSAFKQLRNSHRLAFYKMRPCSMQASMFIKDRQNVKLIDLIPMVQKLQQNLLDGKLKNMRFIVHEIMLSLKRSMDVILTYDIISELKKMLLILNLQFRLDFEERINEVLRLEQYCAIEEFEASLFNLLLTFCQFKTEHKAAISPLIINTIQYVNRHYQESISLYEIADAMNVSASYLSRVFNAEMGVSLPYFINELRIRKAKHLLCETNLKIGEIALQCGMQNVQYFCMKFKQLTAMRPQEYRQINQK